MHKHSRLFLLSAGFLMLFANCTKNDIDQQPVETPVVKLTNDWLNSRIKEGSAARNARIEVLREHILSAQSFTEALEDGEKLIIVPIAKEFKMNTNSDKDADHYLLLFENKTNQVYKGNIVQFIPLDVQQRNLPKNTLSRLWNCENVTANGTFTVLTIFDKHLYEVDFNKGVKTRYATLEKGTKNSNGNEVLESTASSVTCVEWYRETTYYYSDGSSYTTQDYLGTTCYNNCGPTTEVCEPSSTLDPDGGANDGDDEYEVVTTVDWNVYTHSLFTYISSTERLKGKRRASLPNGGYFTKITHLGTSKVGSAIATWDKTSVEVNYNQHNASSHIIGRYTLSSNPTVIVHANKTKNFTVADDL
ncbi:hypothetical protein ACFS6H_14255 [Terrimonas rubra]|uniref:Uncharacterized protein n=1 Tax=Terrimonas rubra TaxID=1035890 RepID=A0ABW6AAC6_9BACT